MIDIHPCDVADILNSLSDGDLVVLKIPDPEYVGSELIEIKGQLYRQTVCVEPKTGSGQTMDSEVFRNAK